jgi:hypothetical protein
MMISSEAAGAAVLVSVVPKRESFTDGTTPADPKRYQQLSSKKQQEQYWKQQHKSPGISPQNSPPQVSPGGSTRGSRQPSRRSTGSVPMRSLEEWLEGDVNLAAVMLQQRCVGGSVAAAAAAAGVQESTSLSLPVLQESQTSLQQSAATSSSLPAAAAAAGNRSPFMQHQQQQQLKKAAVPLELPSSMNSAYGVMSLQEIDYSDAGAQFTSASTSKDRTHSSSSARHSSGNAAVYGRAAASLAAAPGVSPDVHSWVAGLPDGSPAAIAMQQCAERACAAQIEVIDALKYSLDLSRCSGTDSCSNSNMALPHVAASGSAAAVATTAAARVPRRQAAGASDATNADESSSKDSSGLLVTAIALEQQEMLRRLKAFKGRLGSSGGAKPAQAARQYASGGRLSPSLSLASSFTACTGGRQDGLSCRSAGRENSSSAVASKWGTYYI